MFSAPAGFRSGKGGKTPSDLLVEIGPTLRVDVGLRSRSVAGEKPDLSCKNVKALIDTGAGADCIDDSLARRLGLPITDEGEISGIGGRHRACIYVMRLYVPSLDRLLFQPFTGVNLREGRQMHEVILGRTFLRQQRLIYDGVSGQVEIMTPA